MAKLKAALAAVVEKLGLNQAALGRARRRHKKFRERTEDNHAEQLKAEERADAARANAQRYFTYGPGGDGARGERATLEARKQDRVALRCQHRALKAHNKALYWKGRIKHQLARIHHLQRSQAQIEAEMAKLGSTLDGNQAKGGTASERFHLVALASVANCSAGKRRNFYSQAGSWDVHHEVEPGPSYGERSDCSQYVTGLCWSAGLPDPNGADFTGGYTGTLVQQNNGWRKVSTSEMKRHGWGYVVYGGGTGHHVEGYIGPGDRTAGHGSPPVDFGVVDLFGDGDYRCYIYKEN